MRVKPMIVEWEPGSDLVGDFTFLGFGSEIMITDRVLTAFEGRFQGFEPGPVKMVQDRKLRKPKRPTKRTKPRVWLPYEGPRLHDLWVTAWVHMDPKRSSTWLIRRCATCGDERYEVSGVEEVKRRLELGRDELVRTRIPRTPGLGLYVRERDLAGADIFHVYEFSGGIYCTDKVKAFIEREGFTNVAFLERGDII